MYGMGNVAVGVTDGTEKTAIFINGASMQQVLDTISREFPDSFIQSADEIEAMGSMTY